jgi:hypothetical protein
VTYLPLLRCPFVGPQIFRDHYGWGTNEYASIIPVLFNSNLGLDYIWGVVDMVPDTDFPDIRNRCAIHSNNGSCMIVPREGDKVRLYLQLTDSEVLNTETGRVDKNKMGPEKLMQVAKKSFYPYSIHASEFDWWTIYISESNSSCSCRAAQDVLMARLQLDNAWRPGSRCMIVCSLLATLVIPTRQRPDKE